MAYQNPFGFATMFPPGTPERAAIARAQDEAQRIIVIVGLCIGVLSLLSAVFLLDNYKLPDTQSLEESEDDIVTGKKTQRNAPVDGLVA